MRGMPDRYATVGKRDFRGALEYLLETEFKLVGWSCPGFVDGQDLRSDLSPA